MSVDVKSTVDKLLATYDALTPVDTADALRCLWLGAEPKSVGGIKAEQRAQQETVGTPVEVLRAIGKQIGKVARKQVDEFVPLARLLWQDYGREGKGVAVEILGPMELADPDRIVPLIVELSRSCVTWEDADRAAMYALEPIVRKRPEQWLPAVEPLVGDRNKWVRRVAAIVLGRLPMKQAAYTARCLNSIERLMLDDDVDVKKATSFAIRLAARGETGPVRDLLARHVPPDDPRETWVLCDAIRSMAKKLLPDFAPLLPLYGRWAEAAGLSAKDRRSVEAAVRTLERVRSA
jgi:3-methyladenine DNA glycosylase AlkD